MCRWMSIALVAGLSFLASSCSEYSFKEEQDPSRPGDTGMMSEPGGDDSGGTEEYGDGTVTGRICDTTGNNYVAGAYVYLPLDTDGDGSEDDRLETETDADGYFTLTGVPIGAHTIYVEKGSFSATIDIDVEEEGELVLAEEECLDDDDVEIAVITGYYDSIQAILLDLGLDFTSYNGTSNEYLKLLMDSSAMAEYDIIFINCGTSNSWVNSQSQVGANIKEYVENGGSIYASDWSYFFFEVAFPSAVDFYGEDTQQGSAYVGVDGNLNATVLDSTMKSVLGSSSAELYYDLGSWVVPTSAGSGTDVLLEGSPSTYSGTEQNVPLAVRIESGGTAIYTTFHNESQITVDMSDLLQEIIYSL